MLFHLFELNPGWIDFLLRINKIMKKYSQFMKTISVSMIFILLMQLSGCYSYRTISNSDLPLSDSGKYSYVIHSQNSKYLLKNTIISNGILSGKIDSVNDSRQIGKKIHLYLSSDSVMKINKEKILSLPLDGIAKVEIAKVDVIGTIALAAVSALVIFEVVSLVLFSSSGGFNITGNH
jgi:hypothetical protein